ncbi:MAG: rhodanese-like domain-containing protein [Nitratireductor sp.]
MPKTVKDMIAEANAAVPKISFEDARVLIASGEAIVVDVRDAPELEKTGTVAGALHISRGMLDFRADSESPYHEPALKKDKPVIVYCASGGRSALSGKLLKDMGYEKVFNLGAFKDWAEAGGAVKTIVDPGM